MALSAPELIGPEHDVSTFACGKPALDHWLKTRGLSNHQRGFTAVTVVCEGKRAVGYYGVAPTAVAPTILPRAIRTGQPPDPVPCLLLGQLATDLQWAGQGVGTGLLRHALDRCIAASRLIGGRALLVKAVDADAAAFWLRRGFLATKDDEFLFVRSIASLAAARDAAGGLAV